MKVAELFESTVKKSEAVPFNLRAANRLPWIQHMVAVEFSDLGDGFNMHEWYKKNAKQRAELFGSKSSEAYIAFASKEDADKFAKEYSGHRIWSKDNVQEGWKGVAVAGVLAASALGVALSPKATVDGQTYDLATGSAPSTAKSTTAMVNGKSTKVKIWTSPGPKHGRTFYLYSKD